MTQRSTPLTQSHAVRLEGITKMYDDYTAVDSLDLEIRPGEFLSLLGPSGCGKTTTLRILAGFIEPTKGRVFVDDREITNLPPHKRNIGMVFQNYALWPHMTVFANIAFGLKLRRMGKSEIQRKVDEVLELTNLAGLGDRYPHTLSGGQQQRVALSRALALNPPVLLMDEPLSNLDRKLRNSMRRELKQLQGSLGVTTIFVTHDQEEALSMSDRVGIMNEGRLLTISEPAEIYDDPRLEFVADFVGNTNLLSGRVERASDDTVTIRTEAGLQLQLNGQCAAASGRSVTVLIRPERVEISEARPAGPNVFGAKISFVEYYGPIVRYVVELPNHHQFNVETQNTGALLKENKDVYIQVAPSNLSIVD